jgi:hypothetical protein
MRGFPPIRRRCFFVGDAYANQNHSRVVLVFNVRRTSARLGIVPGEREISAPLARVFLTRCSPLECGRNQSPHPRTCGRDRRLCEIDIAFVAPASRKCPSKTKLFPGGLSPLPPGAGGGRVINVFEALSGSAIMMKAERKGLSLLP